MRGHVSPAPDTGLHETRTWAFPYRPARHNKFRPVSVGPSVAAPALLGEGDQPVPVSDADKTGDYRRTALLGLVTTLSKAQAILFALFGGRLLWRVMVR